MTISGPPTTLKQLFQTSSALTSNHAAIPVYGPYHAPHLHKGVDIDQILHSKDSKTSDLLSAYSLALPLMSTSSGVCFDRNLDAPTLFTAVIRDILTETLSIQQIVDGCTKLATEADCGECNIISFGPSNSKSVFAKAMESEKDFKVTLHEDLAAKLSEAPSAFGDAPRTSKRPKLAIVGMAGRFPNAADHEKFWDLLEAGLDVHKRVWYPYKPITMAIDGFVQRYLRIDSMWRLIMIRQAKSEIQVIPLLAASSTSLDFSIHGSSTCLLVRQLKQIRCTAWVWQAHTRPSKWPATYPTDPHLPGWSELEPFTVRRVTTGERSMKRKTLIPTLSLPESEHSRL